ncbi:MAG: SDR family NAD(P)-dependent oxidoreductase [Hyphomicrobiaceae bacterium]|nr:SDR family NAD(P)-dependent oxidoreductase [Hyphomicrobiaceae bacterium]
MSDSLLLADRIALVTGVSRGLGEAAALALAKAGAHVIGIARTQGGLEALEEKITAAGGACTMVPFDLSELDRIDDLGAVIYEKFERLDILVGNAGTLGPLSPLGHIKTDEWNKVIDLNLNANWRLIRIFDPLLRRSSAGRALFVTSGAASANLAYWGPYAISKAALDTLVKTYAAEIASTKMRANLLDPGVVRTGMRMRAFPGEDPATLPNPHELGHLFVKMCSADFDKNGETIKFSH